MNNRNFKKIFSFTAVITITALIGGALSYVRAAYVEPAGSPVGNNIPAPIMTGNVEFQNGELGWFKTGKLGVTKDKTTTPVDEAQFNASSLVVMGLLNTESLTSSYSNRIRAELDTNSALYPLYVGDPTKSIFMQMNQNNTDPLTFKVSEHTRAPRMVIGSKTAPADLYNFYVEPGSNATNLGKSNSYCTLTASKLTTGCPARRYMGQIIPGTGSEVVAACYSTTPVASPVNEGACN